MTSRRPGAPARDRGPTRGRHRRWKADPGEYAPRPPASWAGCGASAAARRSALVGVGFTALGVDAGAALPRHRTATTRAPPGSSTGSRAELIGETGSSAAAPPASRSTGTTRRSGTPAGTLPARLLRGRSTASYRRGGRTGGTVGRPRRHGEPERARRHRALHDAERRRRVREARSLVGATVAATGTTTVSRITERTLIRAFAGWCRGSGRRTDHDTRHRRRRHRAGHHRHQARRVDVPRRPVSTTLTQPHRRQAVATRRQSRHVVADEHETDPAAREDRSMNERTISVSGHPAPPSGSSSITRSTAPQDGAGDRDRLALASRQHGRQRVRQTAAKRPAPRSRAPRTAHALLRHPPDATAEAAAPVLLATGRRLGDAQRRISRGRYIVSIRPSGVQASSNVKCSPSTGSRPRPERWRRRSP